METSDLMLQAIETPRNLFAESKAWPEFHEMVVDLLEKGKSTGVDTPDNFLDYTRLNLQRIRRSLRTTRISEEARRAIENLKGQYNWLVISEGWCADAAITLPILYHLSELTDQIDLRITLRDEHPSLMDQFLTNGARSIPILIIMNADTGEVLASWGPRPAEAQEMMIDMKANEINHDEIVQNLQLWYAKDKGQSTIAEIIDLMLQID